MIWCYDNAIQEDLLKSFTPEPGKPPVVSVVPPEDIISIAAQVQDDKIHFPLIALSREDSVPVDTERLNFTMLHKGVGTVVDKETNMIYYEKVMPIKLDYTLVCMATNTADVDELVRELLFKYTHQYFLTITVPYESKRKIRFGVRVNPDEEIERVTTTSNYLNEGKLHSAGIKLHIDGAVMITYTPQKLRRLDYEIETGLPKGNETGV